MYKVLTLYELVCAIYDHIYVSIDVLPEGICCCLQTCNSVVMFMLMNNVCVQSFNFIRASISKLWSYLCPYHNVLPEAVYCCFTRTTLFTKHSICRCTSSYENLYSQSFVLIASAVNELCVLN